RLVNGYRRRQRFASGLGAWNPPCTMIGMVRSSMRTTRGRPGGGSPLTRSRNPSPPGPSPQGVLLSEEGPGSPPRGRRGVSGRRNRADSSATISAMSVPFPAPTEGDLCLFYLPARGGTKALFTASASAKHLHPHLAHDASDRQQRRQRPRVAPVVLHDLQMTG